jgi:hypothetical protein
LRVDGRDEVERSCERHVEIKGLLEAMDVVEAEAVGVAADRPDEDDMMRERAASVCAQRDVDGPAYASR